MYKGNLQRRPPPRVAQCVAGGRTTGGGVLMPCSTRLKGTDRRVVVRGPKVREIHAPWCECVYKLEMKSKMAFSNIMHINIYIHINIKYINNLT